jgi:far upstream element-binding protein
MIIGKKGQMMKMIEAETGTKIRFTPDEGLSPLRECTLTGYEPGIKQTLLFISEIIERTSLSGGRGFSCSAEWQINADFTYDGEYHKETAAVPADKCGLVIGKGGRWINNIIQVSGAHVELSREQGSNPNEKIFNIFGTRSQIKIAIDLIYGKAGIPTGSASQGWRNQFGERVQGCWGFCELDYTTSDSLESNVFFKKCLRDFDSILFLQN